MNKSTKLILASTSPFRKLLLEKAGYQFDAIRPEVDEKTIVSSSGRDLALLRAKAKGLSVALNYPDAMVIGADQTCVVKKKILDKVETREEARKILSDLSGRFHTLFTAVCVFSPKKKNGPYFSKVYPVRMKMRNLSKQEIEDYLDTNEWQGSVGCYKIEGQGIRLFEKIEGDYWTIIGLPILALNKII